MGAFPGEADFGEAQKNQAEDRCGVFLGLEAGIGAELVGGVPKPFFQRGVLGVFFGWCDPVHEVLEPGGLRTVGIVPGHVTRRNRISNGSTGNPKCAWKATSWEIPPWVEVPVAGSWRLGRARKFVKDCVMPLPDSMHTALAGSRNFAIAIGAGFAKHRRGWHGANLTNDPCKPGVVRNQDFDT